MRCSLEWKKYSRKLDWKDQGKKTVQQVGFREGQQAEEGVFCFHIMQHLSPCPTFPQKYCAFPSLVSLSTLLKC